MGRTAYRLLIEEIKRKIRGSRKYKERLKKVLEEYKRTGKLPKGFTFLRNSQIQEMLEKDC